MQRAPHTNPMLASHRRQQILVPKELFPLGTNSLHNNHQYQTQLCDSDGNGSASISGSSNSSRRPVKLPLRKHHSFHFQPSQTVAGAMSKTKNRYKNNGPLIFKPFNEKSAFKPITPVPKSPNKMNNTGGGVVNSGGGGGHSNTAPRICGTSLKRHISNVETYNANRIDETNSMSEEEDSTSTTPPSTSSASTARGKRLHYADLAPLSVADSIQGTTTSSTLTSNTTFSLSGSNNNGSGMGTGSSGSNSSCDNRKLDNLESNGMMPMGKRTTQYATLKFDEVNI